MRVLAITNLYPRPGHETLAPFNHQQFAALAREHELAVIAPIPWTEEVRDRWSGRRVPVRYRTGDEIEVRHPRYYFTPRVFRAAYGRFFLTSIRREFHRLSREMRPEVVLGCWAHPDGWAAVRLAREAGLPSIIKVVGSDVLVAGKSGRRRELVGEALRAADAVASVGEALARRVVDLGVDPSRVHLVPEGLDGSLFHPGDRDEARVELGLPAGDPIVLYVGNLLASKGVGVLVEALAALNRRGVCPRCFFVGRGRGEAQLRAEVRRLGLESRATLVGHRPLAELPAWYRACNLVALPSFSEGIPNVLREAAACARPFVATAVGGIPEIAGRSPSRLVPPGDPTALADAIDEVLRWGPQSPTGWISWDESASRLCALLASCVASRAALTRPAAYES